MTVLRITVPDQYFCTKHPDLNITAQEENIQAGIDVAALVEIITSVSGFSFTISIVSSLKEQLEKTYSLSLSRSSYSIC